MKNQTFEGSNGLQVTWREPREGPPSFLVYEPHYSKIFLSSRLMVEELGQREGLLEWLDELSGASDPEGQTE